ncbi:MAG: FprA family A-type flavoprotein, partial [Pelotomaculaceae bacterium]
DEKIVLVDAVKQTLADELLSRVRGIIDPAKIDYLVVNHVEPDHSGSVPRIMEAAPGAKIVTSPRGQKGLQRYYKKEWNYILVNSGDELKTGARTMKFVHMPMVHWPESMATYIPEEKLLLPNDAFGQHIASVERFDDELGWDIAREEAGIYYANIVYPYGNQVNKVLDAVSQLPVEMIAPSHGVIWRSHIPGIISCYRKWANHEAPAKALIIYDTMWGSTRKIAQALQDGLEDAGIPVTVRSLQNNHISHIVPDLLNSRAVLIGTPTLNNGMLPSVAALLTYLKGLRPKKKLGFAFGSYGWGGQGATLVLEALQEMGWEVPLEMINIQYNPNAGELDRVRETGRKLAHMAKLIE